MKQATSILRFLLLLLFTYQVTQTALPGVRVYHVKVNGFMQCDCGCACGEHPEAADSCLNPVNQDIRCGCEKEHRREYTAPHPSFSRFLPLESQTPASPPDGKPNLHVEDPHDLLAGYTRLFAPPH